MKEIGAGYLNYRLNNANYLSGRNSVNLLLNSRVNSRFKIKYGTIFNNLFINND